MYIIASIRGQAVVEYILLFSILSFLVLGLANGLGGFVSTSVGGLGYALTQQLSVGVCADTCFFSGYANR